MPNTLENLMRSPALAGPAQEDLAAREVRKEKAASPDAAGTKQANEDADNEQPRSLRQRMAQARRAMDIKKRAKERLEEKVMAPAKQGTNSLLRWAWRTLIPSWGLSLIYINIHIFLRFVLGEKLFCKLGEEWIPKEIKKAGGKAGETGGKAIGIIEVVIVGILDVIAGAVFLGAVVLFIIIIQFLSANWPEQLGFIWEALRGLGWGAVEAIRILLRS